MLRRARPLVPLAVVLLLAQALLGADCVDGVTPDCSGDAAAQCGPIEGGGTDSSVPLPESGADTSPPVDSGTDASTADVVDANDAG